MINGFGLVRGEIEFELLHRVPKRLESVSNRRSEGIDGFPGGRGIRDQHVLFLAQDFVVHLAAAATRLLDLNLIALEDLGCSGHGGRLWQNSSVPFQRTGASEVSV